MRPLLGSVTGLVVALPMQMFMCTYHRFARLLAAAAAAAGCLASQGRAGRLPVPFIWGVVAFSSYYLKSCGEMLAG
jgi:uncharacterized membrane protein YccC